MEIRKKSDFVSLVRSLRSRKDSLPLDQDIINVLQHFINKIPFYHQIELIKGVFTPGFMTHEQAYVLRAIEQYIIPGSRVFDVGCRDGLFTLASHKQGAQELVAIDIDPSEGFKEIVAPIFDMTNVQYLIGNFLDPALEIPGQFDYIIFAGLLYHLRYPFLGLKKASDLLKDDGIMILETAYLHEFSNLPLLLCPVGDYSPFEPTSVTFFNRRGLLDTLASFSLKVIDVVAEFTFVLGNKTRYEELEFHTKGAQAEITLEKDDARSFIQTNASSPFAMDRTNPGDSNIGRLVWICQKVKEPIVPWTHPSLTPEIVRKYWDLTANTHNKPMWSGQRGIGSSEIVAVKE